MMKSFIMIQTQMKQCLKKNSHLGKYGSVALCVDQCQERKSYYTPSAG